MNAGERVTLREIATADLPRLHALDQRCFPAGIAYSRREIAAMVTHPSAASMAAELGDALAGFAVVRPMRRLLARTGSYAPALHILTLDVSPETRRSGVGSALMDWIAAHARALHLDDIVLEVAVDNIAALAFYRSHGFRETGSIAGYYNGTLDALTMEREAMAG